MQIEKYEFNKFHDSKGVVKRIVDEEEIPVTVFITEDDIIEIIQQDYTEINPPRSEVWQLHLDQNETNPIDFTVKLPIGEDYILNKSDLKFWKDETGIGNDWQEITNITQHEKWLNPSMGSNEDPLSTDWVWAFRCNEPFNPNYLYKVTYIDRKLKIRTKAGRPFEGDLNSIVYDSVISDNIKLMKLPSPLVWVLYRWKSNSGGVDEGIYKKSRKLGATTIWKDGFRRYKFLCIGEKDECTLKEITSRITDGYFTVFKDNGVGAKYRVIPFRFGIYNTETGARSDIEDSPTYALQVTGQNAATKGLRRINK